MVGLPSSILSGFFRIDTGDVGAEFGKITLVLLGDFTTGVDKFGKSRSLLIEGPFSSCCSV